MRKFNDFNTLLIVGSLTLGGGGCAPFVGPQGHVGAAGPAGESGPAGTAGSDGVPGATGSQGPQGAAGPTGQDGAAGNLGAQGEAGPQGEQGQTGPVGPQGNPGVNASGVTVVQLCPPPTSYPTTFSEVAFCIDSKLYATYSANGGFSTEIPPGAYSSNGINSSCTFIVGTNCQVTH